MPLRVKDASGEVSRRGKPAIDAEQIRDWLHALVGGAGGLVEMRALGVTRGGQSGKHAEHQVYANSPDRLLKLAKDALAIHERAEGVYFTLNPIRSDAQMGMATDEVISHRRLLVLDIDPVRPPDTNATDAEKQNARVVMTTTRHALSQLGWPKPAVGDSGNGYHLIYRVDLPNDDDTRALCRNVLRALSAAYSDETAKIDVSVFNAARICKLYGTLARKAEHTADRPCRLSRLEQIPEEFTPVPRDRLEAMAAEAPAEDRKPRPTPQPNGHANGHANGHTNGVAHHPTLAKTRGRLHVRDRGQVDPVEAYCHEGLAKNLAELRAAVPGDRNHTLFRTAAAVYQLTATGELDDSHATAELEAAARSIGLPDDEIQKTLDSARKAGRSQPRDLTRVGKKTRRGKAHEAPVVEDPSTGLKVPVDDPTRLARIFLEREHTHPEHPTLAYWDGQFWRWSAGRWRAEEEKETAARVTAAVHGEFVRVAVEAGAELLPASSRALTNVLLNVKSLALVRSDRVEAMPAWLDGQGPPPAECLPTTSGVVHLPALLEHGPDHPGAVVPTTPRFFSSSGLSYAFDPAPPPPAEWQRFLGQLWPDDPESIRALQQWFGYLLTPDTRQQKILLVVGPKRSGKGTITRVLKSLVGEANVASPTFHVLASQFGLQSLIGKSVAVCPEARISGRLDSQAIVERLLSISGEDPQFVDRKHLSAWHGTLRVRFVLLSNELPRLGDYSNALAGRFVVLQLKNSFYGAEDHGLEGRLLAELPGILMWAIDGWRDLRESGRLLQPASSADLVEEFEELSNPVGTFLSEKCELGSNHRIPAKDLYKAWCTWCEVQGREKPGDAQGFGRNLRTTNAGIRVTRSRVHGEIVRFYEGVRLRVEEDSW